MAAKRKITIKKKEVKPEVKEEIVEVEKAVETVVEEEISDVVKPEPKNLSGNVIGTIWKTVVAKPKGQIRFEAQVAPVPLFKLPADIRQYLINKGLSSDVYKKDKEWLEKHNVDMNMVQKLKDFLTGM